MKIGIRAHDIGKYNNQDFVNALKEKQIKTIQLVLNKSISNYQSPITPEKALILAQPLITSGIDVAMLGAYFNPVHSNEQIRKEAIQNFKDHLMAAELFKTEYVGSETGSYNDDKWTYHPQNETEEAYQRTLSVFQDLVKVAEKVQKKVAIEGAYHHVISTPQRLKRLVDDLNSDHVSIIVDLFNYLNINNHTEYKAIFDECINLFQDRIVIFHLKNYIVEEGKLVQVSLEKGRFDYFYLLSTRKKRGQQAALILEGIRGEEITTSIDFINNILNKLS